MSLLPSTNFEPVGSSGALAQPPSGFFNPGRIVSAKRSECPFKGSIYCDYDNNATAARRAGMSYEKRVKSRLESMFGDRFEPGVWFQYQPEGMRSRFCQLDGLISSVPCPIVFEIKIRWMDTAWWQLSHVYGPVVEAAGIGKEKPSLVAIVRSYDPAVVVPKQPRLLYRAEKIPELAAGEMAVVIWK